MKCQFTKETNRRMSNIRSAFSNRTTSSISHLSYQHRHNQDLQKELAQAKSQVNQLRSMLENAMDQKRIQSTSSRLATPDRNHLPSQNLLQLPEAEGTQLHMAPHTLTPKLKPAKRRRIANISGSSGIRPVVATRAQGIFKSPYPNKRAASPMVPESELPILPSRLVADSLIAQYHITLHPTLPLLHWPSFREQYNAVYEAGSLRRVSRAWIALLYAMFACGSLHDALDDTRRYLEISRSMVDMWAEDLTLDHARIALLTSICLVEMNLKATGWIWAGLAVRICFDIGLHCEAGIWPAIEEEMRRRVWWCTYACDW